MTQVRMSQVFGGKKKKKRIQGECIAAVLARYRRRYRPASISGSCPKKRVLPKINRFITRRTGLRVPFLNGDQDGDDDAATQIIKKRENV